MVKKTIKRILFYILSFTWGLPLTLFGLLIFISLAITGHKPKIFCGRIYVEVGNNWGGLEGGPFFICNKGGSLRIKCHECGHGLQNLIWDPLTPVVITIPSAIRYWYREFKYYKAGVTPPTDYDSIWFEGQATRWGLKYFGNSKEEQNVH